MRWLGILLRIVGWLLTPLVAWAASLWGAWLAFGVSDRFDDPRFALYVAVAVAVVTGTACLFGWMQLLRKSPRLRKSLHITREGLPVIDEPPPPGSGSDAPAKGNNP
jgi:hypothetical protein